MSKKPTTATVGSSFESLLEEQGTLTETTNQAIKRVIAYQLERARQDQPMTKGSLADALYEQHLRELESEGEKQ